MNSRSRAMIVRSTLNKLTTLVSVPWNSFVAAFLYYTLLAAMMLAGNNPGNAAVAGAYAMPPVVYAATILVRLYRVAAAWLHAHRPHGITQAAHTPA
jgi:hypothetical protein